MADDPRPVAYCAPGKRAIAGTVLTAYGEEVREIIEHPWLEGYGYVLVCAPRDDAEIPWPVVMSATLPPAQYRFTPPPLTVLTSVI